MHSKIAKTILAIAALSAIPVATHAAPVFGSSGRATVRSCALTGATARCDGRGPGQGIVTQVFGGGRATVDTTTDLTLSPTDYARSKVSFGALDLPEIRAETRATGNQRLNINTFGFQSYTFGGAASAAFSLTGALHIVDSSTNPTDGALPGGAIYSQYVAIWDPSVLGSFTTAQQLANNLFYAGCDTPGVLGMASGGSALAGGEATYMLTTAECTPGSLILAPGQEVLAVAGLQLPVNRGGFVDSTHSFVTRLGDDLTPEQKSVLTANLVSAVAAGVPEPASWALLLTGFGVVGGAMRRRVAVAA